MYRRFMVGLPHHSTSRSWAGASGRAGYTFPRPPMSETARKIYSPQRLKIVALLLSLIFLPIVIGTSALIYNYLRFSVMVERRLQGERWMIPSRVCGRPLRLRPGLVLEPPGLVKVLNSLRYTRPQALPEGPGPFAGAG